MASWSKRRQTFYLGGVFAVFVLVVVLPTFYVNYIAPSCTDGKQNHKELGVDCGGPCAIVCKGSAVSDLLIRWQRTFKVKDGVYNALAYVENPNADLVVDSVPYLFKLYDKDNILIYEKRGTTFVPAKKVFGIFENNLLTGGRAPARAFFEFSASPVWKKTSVQEPSLSFNNQILSDEDRAPRLSASLRNAGLNAVRGIEAVAVVYGADNNAIAASRTTIDQVAGSGSAPVVFTWPSPFEEPVTRAELIYRILPK